MTRGELETEIDALCNAIDEINFDLNSFRGTSYDEDYKIEQWHTHLTPELFVEIRARVQALQESIAKMKPFGGAS